MASHHVSSRCRFFRRDGVDAFLCIISSQSSGPPAARSARKRPGLGKNIPAIVRIGKSGEWPRFARRKIRDACTSWQAIGIQVRLKCRKCNMHDGLQNGIVCRRFGQCQLFSCYMFSPHAGHRGDATLGSSWPHSGQRPVRTGGRRISRANRPSNTNAAMIDRMTTSFLMISDSSEADIVMPNART